MKQEEDAIKKNQGNKRELLKIKNTIAEMENSLEGLEDKVEKYSESRTKRQEWGKREKI